MTDPGRYLVDTSAWIDFLRGASTEAVGLLRRALERGRYVGLTPVVLQEVLQGAEDAASFERLEAYFASQAMILPSDPIATHVEAARLYFQCRRAGITIRSTIDCLIAQLAMENDLVLIHSDRDFERMREVAPELKLAG